MASFVGVLKSVPVPGQPLQKFHSQLQIRQIGLQFKKYIGTFPKRPSKRVFLSSKNNIDIIWKKLWNLLLGVV